MAGLDWMYEWDLPLLSLTFARGLTARQLLERMGADPATLALREQDDFLAEFGDILRYDDACVASAGEYGPWAWAWEHSSWLCIQDEDLVRRVSVGTTGLVLHANEKSTVVFRYAEDGQLITGISTLIGIRPEDRTGSNPHRFSAELLALGADPEHSRYGPLGGRGTFFRLAENLGVGLPHVDLTDHPVVSARLRP